jgi:hypothetical protein
MTDCDYGTQGQMSQAEVVEKWRARGRRFRAFRKEREGMGAWRDKRRSSTVAASTALLRQVTPAAVRLERALRRAAGTRFLLLAESGPIRLS